MSKRKREMAGMIAGILLILTCFPYLPAMHVQGAVTFGDLTYSEELVAEWDALANAEELERTDMQNHYTSTYPSPKVIASVKQQTGRSIGGQWKELEYRNVYCISHSGEAANNPVSSMVCASVWYAGEPYTLQNLPDYMRAQAGGDAYRLRFNFLMLAYGADYHAGQNGVNSDSIVGTADYYLCQGICTLTEEARFTGDYEADWALYQPVVMDWAERFHPNGNGDSRVYEEMKANAQNVFRTVWNTAKLMAECTESQDTGFVFHPVIVREADGIFHAKFPLTRETRAILTASTIRVQGDWQYRFTEAALEFWSPSGELPASGYLAELDLSNVNGIRCASIGNESVRELHQPVQVRGTWSLTYAQTNLVSGLKEGTRIMVGSENTSGEVPAPVPSGSGEVKRYRHKEIWQADYAVQLRKFDSETGMPLEGAQFDILEAFDSSQLDGSVLEDDNWENDSGSQFFRWEGWDSPYEELGDEPCPKDQEITDADGWLTEMESAGAGPLRSNGKRAHRDVKYYAYTKGYCGGHPEPDPDDEEGEEEYERELEICERLAAAGGFFHSLNGAAAELRADRDRHYQEFVSLTYEYSARELTAREGYILHNQEEVHEPDEKVFDGIHPDTVPIETVTVHSSQYYELGSRRDATDFVLVEAESDSEKKMVSDMEVTETGKTERDVESVDSDIPDEDATPSDAAFSDATPSNATDSNAVFQGDMSSRILPGKVEYLERTYVAEHTTYRFQRAAAGVSLRNSVRWSNSLVPAMSKTDTSYDGADTDWIFKVYDHRTEGELHMNKRDLTLKRGELEGYDSYGAIQGDAVLEEAVYGLFAAEDIIHPDGKTGVVYQKGNLTAIAATDKNGDASFTAYTVAPGMIYDYESGELAATGFAGPENLYRNQTEENCWIGRPLILGSYYLQELTRSEGYELSVYGIDAEVTNRTAWVNGGEICVKGEVRLDNVEEQMMQEKGSGQPYLVTQLTFASDGAENGYDVRLKGIDPQTYPSFYATVSSTKEVYAEWEEPVSYYEPVEAEPGARVIIQGASVEAVNGAEILLPNGDRVTVTHTEICPVNGNQVVLTGEKGSIPTFDQKYLPELTGLNPEQEAEFVSQCNEALKKIGLQEPGDGAPYMLVELGEQMQQWPAEFYDFLESESCPAFNAARLDGIIERDGFRYAVLRYSFLKNGKVQPVLYSAGNQAFYVKYDIFYETEEGEGAVDGYLYRAYPADEFSEEDYAVGSRLYQWIRIRNEKPASQVIRCYEDPGSLQFVSAQEFRSYWVYGPGEFLRGDDGSIYQKEKVRYETQTGYHTETVFQDTPLEAVYEEAEKTYIIHVAPERIPLDERVMISIRYEDIFAGNRTGLSVVATSSADVTGTYIQPVVLAYPGQESVYEDAGTRIRPISVLERIIAQKVKVRKMVESSSASAAESDQVGNFRFRIYLKSNLEQLYRDESGIVIWKDRTGQELSAEDQIESNRRFPAEVPKIQTVVQDRTLPDGNYDKFFDAIAVANHDKWDDAAPTYTSWHPIGNLVNRKDITLDNARVSDAVRQFAIDWYLDAEVETLIQGRSEEAWGEKAASYTDELHDTALWKAIQKAQDYLKPFFDNDLDEIYAIPWDSEEGGGKDRDVTTLSADAWEESGCSGVSIYLPYGTYIVVEQQPYQEKLGDFRNKHYQVDKPKEVVLPVVYEGDFSQKQVPWSVVDPGTSGESVTDSGTLEAHSGFRGYDCVDFVNRMFTAKLRLEKLDTETHENLLHDGAVFQIYRASRSEDHNGGGEVRFYEKPTMISGTKEFLEAMGAEMIRPMARVTGFWHRLFRTSSGPGNLYTGTVPAGTPICEEHDLVMDSALSTVRDGAMTDSEQLVGDGLQTVGYLRTPREMEAGAYVLCEMKPPAGYVRSRPIAFEIYSDKITYYQQGKRDQRVLAALYEDVIDMSMESGDRAQDRSTMARIYVENEPIRLEVRKVKESSRNCAETTPDQSVTYKVSGRIDGALADIGDDPAYVYAYENGQYLGYAWRKGTLKYLLARKAAGEQVEIVYEGRMFAGYGYVTRKLETADDENPYVTGAQMTLFEAMELLPSGDREDHAYEGLVVERDPANYVTRMYVRKGYAGTRMGVSGQVVERSDTDILYFSLDSLAITETEVVDGQTILYGYDRNHERVRIDQLESDRNLYNKTDMEHSIFAFREGVPYLEITGGDFTEVAYDRKNKIISTGSGTCVYHLDQEGNRDALVDPYTGMAYVASDTAGKVFVWPVIRRHDAYGHVVAHDKITTSRVATAGENQEGYYEQETLAVINPSGHDISSEDLPSYEHTESGYLTGSWISACGGSESEKSDSLKTKASHTEVSLNQNTDGQNLNGEILIDENHGSFRKNMEPVYDEHGLAVYYQNSGEVYEKGTAVYDRNGDFVRYQDSDNLEEYNLAAYRYQDHTELYDSEEDQENPQRRPLYHRLGENYILENTWITSDRTPNDPFQEGQTDGQPDILKRVPAGTYIMEELRSPEGYLKAMPKGIRVLEQPGVQTVTMVDPTTKVELSKVDGTNCYLYQILDMLQDGVPIGAMVEGSNAFGHQIVPDAELAIFEAEKVFTADLRRYPKGFYLRKTGEEPLRFASTNSRCSQPELLTAQWTTDKIPIYIEGIPQGNYLLEELEIPSGFVRSDPVEVLVSNTPEVQIFAMNNDHTRIEVEKYAKEKGEKNLIEGAGFTLYPAVLDNKGDVVYENGVPQYDSSCPVDSWLTGKRSVYQDFIPAFEEMYRDHGVTNGNSLSWQSDGVDYHASTIWKACSEKGMKHPTHAVMILRTNEGCDIRITISGEQENRQGADFMFEYQFDYRKLPEVNAYACAWMTVEGIHRIDYLPVGNNYVLVETLVPGGFTKASDVLIEVQDTADVQRYSIENRASRLVISKCAAGNSFMGELSDAHLALYKGDRDGGLITDQEHLVTDWISGSDGRYTESDRVQDQIPEGYEIGDLRPHEIPGLISGRYWLVELESPDYYQSMQPLEIWYDQEEEFRLIRVENIPLTGQLTVSKTAKENGRTLSGAVYELQAFRPFDTNPDSGQNFDTASVPVLIRRLSDIGGMVRLTDLPVGEPGKDGKILPYHYELREVTPPDGYAVNDEVFRWEFDPKQEAAKHLMVEDPVTKILIGKKLFDEFWGADGGRFVDGAGLAIYEICGRDEQNQLIYDSDHPVAAWITRTQEPYHIVEGLTAGRSYLLKEWQVPFGYQELTPIMFTLAADGRSLASVTDQMHSVVIHSSSNAQSVTIAGRNVLRTVYDLADHQENILATWAGTGEYVTIDRKDAEKLGIREGDLCTVTEKTCFSDGTCMVTERTTRRVGFCKISETELFRIPTRAAAQVRLSVVQGDSGWKNVFYPDENHQEFSVECELPAGPYVLQEEVIYSNGEILESSRIGFEMDKAGQFDRIVAADRERTVLISKTDMSGTGELAGTQMRITEESGEEVMAWTSGNEAFEISGLLEEGQEYLLEEVCPSDGYSYAESIPFTVQPDTVVEKVLMADDVTRIQIRKEDAESGEALAGGLFQIKDTGGAILDEWSFGQEFYQINGVLKAGETYYLHEKEAPAGYKRCDDLEFTVPLKREILTVTMKNQKRSKVGDSDDSDRIGTPETPVASAAPIRQIKIGTISASYHPKPLRTKAGWSPWRDGWWRNLPWLGDESEPAVPLILCILSFLGVLLVKKKRK